jgi:tetratricopeptide (TPR) repeat protein
MIKEILCRQVLAGFYAAALVAAFIGSNAQAQTRRSAESYLKKGLAMYRNGDLDGALACFDRAILANSRPSAAPQKGAGLLEFTDSPGERPGRSIVVVDAFNALVYYNRGVVQSDMGRLRAAVDDFDAAIRMNPLYVDAYIRRGKCRQSMGDIDGSLADYSKAITLDPLSAYAYNNRGIARRAKQDIAGALSDFDMAISINPRLVDVYVNRGAARCMIDDLDGAIADLDKALSIDPLNSMAFNNRGKAWQLKGDFSKAMADFNRAIALDSNNAMAFANRGLIRLVQGHRPQAESDFERCVRSKPELKSSLEQLIAEIEAAKTQSHR